MPEFAVKLNSNHFVIGLGENTVLSARERALAEAARIEAAASAAYAESMTGPSYADAAAGLAATSDGQGFAVDNGDGTVTVYINDGGMAVFQRNLATTTYLASQDGAKAIGVKQRGASALLRTAEDALRDIPTLAGYSTTAASIAAAVADNFVVGVSDSLTVNIPSDAATLQIALDRLTPLNQKCIITLNIESGHTLTAGVYLSGGDYSQFRIVSVDATVPVSFNGDVIEGFNGTLMPRLACSINCASQASGNGVDVNACDMTVEPGAGAINCHGNGLRALNGSNVKADGSKWSGSARAGTTGACITSWGSTVSAEGADCTGSGFYGVQAAHGGTLAFRGGNASNAFRHGIRATDAATVDADAATANNCSADTTGYSLYAYQGGVINFTSGSATGNLGGATLQAYGAGSAINASEATITGGVANAVRVERGGQINVVGSTVSSTGSTYYNRGGYIQTAEGSISGAPALKQSAIIASGNATFIPHPSGYTLLQVDTEGAAASDDLDTVTPASGFSIEEGYRLVIKSSSNSRDPSIRDITTSGTGSNYGFHVPGNTTIVVGTSVSTVSFVWSSNAWLCTGTVAN